MKECLSVICLFVVVLIGITFQPNLVQGDIQGIVQGDEQAGKVAAVKNTLSMVSTACETYSAANNGNYPSAISDLVDAKPPYLNKSYCDVTVDDYAYTCSFTTAGYTITATPVKGGQAISITTGGSFQ